MIDNGFNKVQLDDFIDEIIDNLSPLEFNKWINSLRKHIQNDEKFYTEHLKNYGQKTQFSFNPLKFIKPVDSELTGIKILKQKNKVTKGDDAIEKKILSNWVLVSDLTAENLIDSNGVKEGSELTFMKLIPVYKPVKGTMKDSGPGGPGGAGCRGGLQWGDI